MNSTKRRAVFLDRDGVINPMRMENGKPVSPRNVADFELLPGVSEACKKLKAAGFFLVVVTNQPEVVRGRLRREDVDAVHAEIRKLLPVDDIRVCFHDDADRCHCRKPAPGMVTDAAKEWGIDVAASFLVGDRWRDVEAGQRAGCRTVQVEGPFREKEERTPDHRARTLSEAAEWILREAGSRSADSVDRPKKPSL